jgi:DNA replication and repair protein RecF
MITDLRLQHLRSYKDSSFELSPGVNIIVGPNASGKTNLLEAILVLARGSSYRVKDTELIQFDQPWARIDANTKNTGLRTVKLFSDEIPNKIYELEGKTYKRLSLVQSLPVVLFEPNHLQLLSGGPERRRDYLDDLLEQTTAGYGTTRRQYRRALAQRNALLKQPSASKATAIFPWNIRLSQLAGQIVRARSDLTEQINKDITKLYKELSKTKTKVRIEYQHRWAPEHYETRLLKELETSLETDIQRGFTSAGPHREDLAVLFDEHPAQETASRGEARTTILALKIIELKIIEATRDATPLLLLDDVFSELDGKRRHALTDYLAPYQTFITTTDADLVIKNFTQKCHIIALT